MTIEIEYFACICGEQFIKIKRYNKVRKWEKDQCGTVVFFENGNWMTFPMSARIKVIQGNLIGVY